jgi:hypothetical protein
LDKFKQFIPEGLQGLNYFNDILSGKAEDKVSLNDFQVALMCNSILIEKFQDEDAILRRLNQLETLTARVDEAPHNQVYSPTLLMQELE